MTLVILISTLMLCYGIYLYVVMQPNAADHAANEADLLASQSKASQLQQLLQQTDEQLQHQQSLIERSNQDITHLKDQQQNLSVELVSVLEEEEICCDVELSETDALQHYQKHLSHIS